MSGTGVDQHQNQDPPAPLRPLFAAPFQKFGRAAADRPAANRKWDIVFASSIRTTAAGCTLSGCLRVNLINAFAECNPASNCSRSVSVIGRTLVLACLLLYHIPLILWIMSE